MPVLSQLSPAHLLAQYQELHSALSSHLKGLENTLHYILACYFTGHHVLLEDFPGTGKTTLAKTLARLLVNTEFKRVQFTPDLLPSDLTGVNIFDPAERTFRFQEGPLFCDVLLADEINRASPRTQSALLEAMAENQVTIEGNTYLLTDHFFVIATQNPVEFRGTYALPEAQMDRFGLQCSLGYLTTTQEKELLDEHLAGKREKDLEEMRFPENLRFLLTPAIKQVRLSDSVKNYVITLISSTREHPEVQLPLSPRATLTICNLAQALAFFKGKEYVTAEHIQELAPLVLAHRILLTSPSQNTTEGKLAFIKELLEKTEVPG